MRRFHGFPYQRVGIDIFPMDRMPADKETAKQKEIIRQGICNIKRMGSFAGKRSITGYLKGYGELCNVEIPQRDNLKTGCGD